MASPQTQDGHIRIANPLWDAWCRFGSPEDRVFKAVVRLTWGWGKKMAAITVNELSEITGMHRRNVIRATGNLADAGMLIKNTIAGKVTEYGINKDFEQWTSDNIATSGTCGTTTRGRCGTTTSGGSVTSPSLLYKTKLKTKLKTNISTAALDKNLEIVDAAEEEKPSRSVLKLCTLFGELNMPRVPARLDHQLEIELRKRPDFDEVAAMSAMMDCHAKAQARAPDFRARSLSYYVDAISSNRGGTEVGNGNSGKKTKRTRSSYGM